MAFIRRATVEDLDFLVAADLLGEGYTTDPEEAPMSEAERAAHREKIRAFVTGENDAGWVAIDEASQERIGMILARYRDRHHEADNEANRFLLRFFDDGTFPVRLPADGRFCEVFNLWVDPRFRRQGLATRLKNQIEEEAQRRSVCMMYTHTETANQHVIELNQKLGYQEIRRGPLWDDVPRVSLVKWLGAQKEDLRDKRE